MRPIDLNHRTIGVNFHENGEAEVCVWVPEADTVTLLINDIEELPLNRGELGYWQAKTSLIVPGDMYKIKLDSKPAVPDPASLAQSEGVHGSSKAIDITTTDWDDAAWQNIPLDQYIIYELHTGTFSPEGTFAGIEKRLAYLKELGVNAIEIMPVAHFPGNRNWGYDGVFPFAVHEGYGGAAGLQRLVNACHNHGMAVILDVVYNHMGPEGNYLGETGAYFTDKYKTPWGEAINFDDAHADGVRRFFIENVLMWFRDFHIDALRMDAVHAIKDMGAVHILQEIKEHVDKLKGITGRQHYLIVECDLNDPRFINTLDEEGYGMDAQWIDEFHHALRVAAGNERTGYYADFDGISHLAKAYKDAYVYDGIYSEHRNRTFGIKTENPGKQFVAFSQNHDQVGNRMLGERTSQLVSFEMQKLMAGAVFVSPFLPMLFMGEEYSEPNPFQYFVSHTDPELVEAVRKGRKEEFASFHGDGEAPDPQSEETFLRSKLQWELLEKEPHATMLRYYRALITLRKQHPVLRYPDRQRLTAIADEEQQTLILHRWLDKQHIVCLMNFSRATRSVSLPFPEMRFHKLLDSADPQWGGDAVADTSILGGSERNVQPESLLIYTNNYV